MPRWMRVIGRLLVTAVAGVLVAAAVATAGWFVVSRVTGAQLVVFETGSMSPTIPQGSVAVGLPRPAAEFAVGDVVTLRPDATRSPVTHRITSIVPDPADARFRLVTMRGDGNARDDLRPYRVTQGLLIVGAAPGMAPALAVLRSPGFMALATLFAAAVLWALWPSTPRGAPRRAEAT